MTEQLHFHFSLSCIREGNGNPLQYSCLENPMDRGATIRGIPKQSDMTEWISNSSKVRRKPPRGEKTLLYILLNILSVTKLNNFVFNIPEIVKEGQTVKFPDIKLNEIKLFGCHHSSTSPFLKFSLLLYFSTPKNIRVFLNRGTAGSTKFSYFFCIRV